MKKLLSLACFSLVVNLLLAHNLTSSEMPLRQWTLSNNNKHIEGSFMMMKGGEIYIEDAANKIQHYPLSEFSKEDQAFAQHKYEAIYALNQPLKMEAKSSLAINVLFIIKGIILFILLTLAVFLILKKVERNKWKYLLPIPALGLMISLYSFAEKAISTTDPNTVDAAFIPFKPNVYTHWDGTWFYVESRGIPTTHNMMIGIRSWQQQVPIPQCYTGSNAWQIPLNPVNASTPVPVNPSHFLRGAVALAVNGVPIFNPYTNTGVDALLDGQLDSFGGHSGRADDYHYHIAPLHLYGHTTTNLPIAYGLDGYAVYGSLEPNGSAMAPLDSNHGHLGTDGIYHYHGTPAAPYMIGRMVGQVTEDTTLQIIPQPRARPVRAGQSPLSGASIVGFKPDSTGLGYVLTYTLSGQTHKVRYTWPSAGHYQFSFIGPSSSSDSSYTGFVQCTLPDGVGATGQILMDDNNIFLYPNPADDAFNVELSKELLAMDVKQIQLYDMNGKLLLQQAISQQAISVKGIAKGMYLVKISIGNLAVTKHLIIN